MGSTHLIARGRRVMGLAATSAYTLIIGSSSSQHGDFLRRCSRALCHPSLLCRLLNAQFRLAGIATVPPSVRLRGRARVEGGGKIVFGDGVVMDGDVTPIELLSQPGGVIEIGDETFINFGTSISAHQRVTIGRACHLGHYVFIFDNDYHDVQNKLQLPESRPVVIEDRVWLGTRVTVLKGVRIGHDAVIGAGSVVTRDVPPCSVAAGVPARIFRRFSETEEYEPRIHASEALVRLQT
jgi:carbonic anhydrase/acetyltransferase-like protein (isoleucine patch superfamily)